MNDFTVANVFFTFTWFKMSKVGRCFEMFFFYFSLIHDAKVSGGASKCFFFTFTWFTTQDGQGVFWNFDFTFTIVCNSFVNVIPKLLSDQQELLQLTFAHSIVWTLQLTTLGTLHLRVCKNHPPSLSKTFDCNNWNYNDASIIIIFSTKFYKVLSH